jgi:uncharacterized Tic20 family protein
MESKTIISSNALFYNTLSRYWTYLFFSIHLFYFYCYIIDPIGLQIREACYSHRACRRFLGYSPVFQNPIDLADDQWRDFRKNLLTLTITALASSLGSKLLVVVSTICRLNDISIFSLLSHYRALVGIVMVFILHGYHSLLIFIIAYITFRITTTLRKR